jgi:fibronectin type 3 domain-containing protein
VTCRRAAAATLLGFVLASALACSNAFDIERAKRLIEGEPQPEIPVLTERPPADLPAVTGLRAVSNELREVPLGWTPASDPRVRGYVIERALGPEGPFERIAVVVEPYDSSFVDRGFDLARKAPEAHNEPGLGDGARYYYRLRGYDAEHHVAAAASETVTGRTAPPPAPPDDLRAFSQLPRRIGLAWRAPTDPHVVGYRVERSPSAAGPFTVVGRVDGRHRTTFVDRDLGDLRVFYYRVSAVSAAGSEGPPTDPVRALTKAEPLPPAELRVGTHGSTQELVWEPNSERDVARYRVQRKVGGAGFEDLASVEAPHFVDETAPPDEPLEYRVIAVDADGLESAPSAPVQVPRPGA